jgi:O-methyltransferase
VTIDHRETDKFIGDVYRRLLHREASPEEVAAVREVLQSNSTTPIEFVLSVAESPEAQSQKLPVQTPSIEADMLGDGPFAEFLERVRPYSMTSTANLYGAFEATRHIVRDGMPGAMVECGVWKGGSSMMLALTLLYYGDNDRDIYLYDTFAGMTEPSEADKRHDGAAAQELWAGQQNGAGGSDWWAVTVDEVREHMLSTGYPANRVHLVQGPVEATIPATAPDSIALLRLDTDWYESTLHEMVHLYPRLRGGGVLIVDDYGWWQGARTAVDEYLATNKIHLLLNRIDPAGARLAIKP